MCSKNVDISSITFLLWYLSQQIIIARYKISCTNYSKKQYISSAEQLWAAHAADYHVILVTWNKAKQTDEWINADEIEKKVIFSCMKENVLHERENSDLADK